jgi:uncharacterized protein YjeT (DUF2065 family)
MPNKHIEEVELPRGTVEKDPKLAKQLAKAEERKSTIGLVVGLICIVAGVIIIYAGVEGSIDWTFKAVGLESKLAKASPGVVLAVVGAIIIWITKFRYVVK